MLGATASICIALKYCVFKRRRAPHAIFSSSLDAEPLWQVMQNFVETSNFV
jgi:hypothetical protein